MSTLPDFLVQDPPLGDPQQPPPYRFEDVGIQLFPVLADGQKLQQVCDYFLNDVATQSGSPIRIDPLMGTLPGIVNIQLLRYPRVYSTAPGQEQLGYLSQNELLFAIPVVLKQWGIPLAVGIFVPYLFVDNSLSVVTGREVVGFTKLRGDFTMPANINSVDGCKVETLANKVFSGNDKFDDQLLFETRSTGIASLLPQGSRLMAARINPDEHDQVLPNEVAKPLWPFGPIDELYGAEQQFAVDERTYELLSQQAGLSMKNYSLKQFRDAAEPGKACYQSIVEGTTDIFQFVAGGILPDAELTIHRFDSLEIVKRLGLDTEDPQGTIIKPLYGIWYHADFNLRNMQNLVTRCGSTNGPGRTPHNCLQLWANGAKTVLGIQKSMVDGCLQMLERMDRDRN